MCAALAVTEAMYIGCRSPVKIPVKKSAVDGVYMSHPQSSTQPKQKLSVWYPCIGILSMTSP